MFISKLRLQNFKRFTDLTIDLSTTQPAPKLVLMIGANGSGKSCVFDAFECISSSAQLSGDSAYHRKNLDLEFKFEISFSVPHSLGPLASNKRSSAFYGRSAHRHVPQLTRQTVAGFVELEKDSDRPRRYIEFDQRFENDVAMLMRKMFADFFGDQSQAEALKKRYLEPINQAFERIFGNNQATALRFHSLLPPIDGKPVEILFSKGLVKEISYDLLSSGEKEVFNILLNLLNRSGLYRDTVYFIDELDVHLNTALQYNLLKEITEEWLPENCQLWTASHSLGFIQYAREAAHAAILDFDQFDFDLPQTITPRPKETSEVFEIAVPAEVLSSLFKDKQIVFCENQNDRLYQLLGFSEMVFKGVRDKNDVYYRVKNNPGLFGLIDRDYLTDVEITRIRARFSNLYVLHYYAFENYLYHPANLAEAVPGFEAAAYQADIVRQKNESYARILYGLKQARSGYKVLTDEKLEDENMLEMIERCLKSDELETFYPYFDMKSKFNHQLLAQLNLPPERLVRTEWFRAALRAVFTR